VPRPGITRPFRSPDEKETLRLRDEHHGNRRPDELVSLLVVSGPMGSQAPAKALELRAQWRWV